MKVDNRVDTTKGLVFRDGNTARLGNGADLKKGPDFKNVVAESGNRADSSTELIFGKGVIAGAADKAETGSDNRMSVTKSPDSQADGVSKDPNFQIDDNVKSISSCNLTDILANLYDTLSPTLKFFSFLPTFLVSFGFFILHSVTNIAPHLDFTFFHSSGMCNLGNIIAFIIDYLFNYQQDLPATLELILLISFPSQ